jgi:hypothetical protein
MAKTIKKPIPVATLDVGNVDIQADVGTIKQPSAHEKLSEAIAALPVAFDGDGIDITAAGKVKGTTLIVNKTEDLNTVNTGGLMNAAVTTATNAAMSRIPGLDPNAAIALQGLAEAPRFREKPRTMHTQVMIDKRQLAIPAQVKDLPNGLYIDDNNNYVRGEADQIVKSLFGNLAKLAATWASNRGFSHKPLLWISQALYEYMELNKKIDYTTEILYMRPITDFGGTEKIIYKPSIPFTPEIDEAEDSILLLALGRCFYFGTVNHLKSRAKENNLSILEVLRAWIGQYDRDHTPVAKVNI